ncbi:hypothetical protein HUO13_24005 [Saccharopolyspora erythraea]|uniref:hypothetical protein n=1 Tax=Saccharopolyspora erythraea TaxID=1836 RepID=UPI001BABEC3A|nr:hypothetical protein [Saccharopolyspora erythraea]QUH03475.1 hypothetical protein HUO13_24005 [Saccharopolyspora erythraea]
MGSKFRKTIRVGPMRVHLSRRGLSWSTKWGHRTWFSRSRRYGFRQSWSGFSRPLFDRRTRRALLPGR